MKRCSKCGKLQDINEFYFQKGSKDGRSSQCRSCKIKIIMERQRERKKEKKEGVVFSGKKKVCKRCKQELPIEYFGRDHRLTDGYNSVCKTCVKHSPSMELKKVMPWELVY